MMFYFAHNPDESNLDILFNIFAPAHSMSYADR